MMELSNEMQTDIIIEAVERVTEQEVIGLVLDMHGELRERNPVLTGYSMNNWLVSVGVPRGDAVGERPIPGTVSIDSVGDSSGGPGMAAAMTWKFGDGPLFLVNNVKYIGLINGQHTQAQGFVEKSIDAAIKRDHQAVFYLSRRVPS